MGNQIKKTFEHVTMPAECAQRIQAAIQLRSAHKELEATVMKPKKKPLLVLVAVFVLVFSLSATAYAANVATDGALFHDIRIFINGEVWNGHLEDEGNGTYTYRMDSSSGVISGSIETDGDSSVEYKVREDGASEADGDTKMEVVITESEATAAKNSDGSYSASVDPKDSAADPTGAEAGDSSAS